MGARSAGLAAGSGRSSPLVRPLTGGVEPAVEFGGKGASLTRLIDAGFPVPGGFCITTEAHRRALAEASPAAVEVSAALGEAILSAYRGLGSPAVAVRSSATVEDGTSDSYAGQFESLLDVRGDDALLAAVQSCWRSAAAERAQSYLRRSGTTDLPAVAVVVQRMVDADAAGVLFTADPVSGNDGVLVVEAVPGVGEALVSGVSDPSRYVVDRQTGTNLRPQEPRPELLGEQDVATLRDLGNRAVELYGTAMDLEWCRERGSMLIVQARPITTAVRSDPWNDSRHGDFLWTNTNVGEAIPDVMTPATWSMVQVFLTDAMATASIPPYIGYGRIGGRIYLNVSVMLTLSGAVGVSEKRFRELTADVFGHLPDDVEIPRVKTGRLPVLKAVLPMAAHMFAEVRRDARVMAAYLDSHPALCERRRADIAAVGHGAALADLWQSTLSPEFHRVSKMLSAATRSSGASFVTTRQRLQRLVGSAAANALTAGLGGEAGELASLGLLDGLDLLARGEIDRPEFARRFGHRGPHEFEISTPRPGEDPDWIDGELSVRREADSEHDYRSMLRRQEDAREAAWAEVERVHPVQAKVLHHQLRIWARISRNRELARSEVIRYFWVLRDYVLRAGASTWTRARSCACCRAGQSMRASLPRAGRRTGSTGPCRHTPR